MPPGSSASSPCRTCLTCLFPGFVTLSYPLTRSRVRRGPAAAAQPNRASSCAASREDFLPTPQWMLSPLLQEGCTATLLIGIPPWQLQEGLGCRKTTVTLPAHQDFTLCLVGDTKAGLRHCLLTAGTPCKLCSHPISWASWSSSLILLVQELHYPALRQAIACSSGQGRTGDISSQYF